MFWSRKNNRKQSNRRLKLFALFGLIPEAFIFILSLIKPKKWKMPVRWKLFIKHEKMELKELSGGQEDFPRFWEDSKQLVKDIFIPNEQNDHKPMALRPKSLFTLVAIALVIKFSVATFLFTTYPSEAELSAIISANMISLINESRTAEGLPALINNQSLVKYAEVKGEDMLARDYFAHDTPEGKRPWEWINRADYDYVYAGENLAIDFVTAEVVHDAFMKSPAHRRNILNEKYREVGIAVLHGELEGRQTTLLVEFFGTQRKDREEVLALANQITGTQPSEVVEETEISSDIAGVQTEDSQADSTPASGARTIQQDPTSPTPGPINEGIIVVSTHNQGSKTLVDFVVEYSNIFFIAFLLFVLISLLLNIFIKIKIQHTSVILQSVVVIALLGAMIIVKFHFAERVAPQLLIL